MTGVIKVHLESFPTFSFVSIYHVCDIPERRVLFLYLADGCRGLCCLFNDTPPVVHASPHLECVEFDNSGGSSAIVCIS